MARTKTKSARENKVSDALDSHLVMKSVTDYLDKEGFRYFMSENDICEILIQGTNASLQLVYYVYQNHLILRIPHFIRNVDVMRPKVIFLINQAMEEVMDIRFEIGEEGKSISAAVQHLLGRDVPTEAQLRYLTMLILNATDEYYQRFLQAIYSGTPFQHFEQAMQEDIQEGIEENEDISITDMIGGPMKIN